jgi:hypothetical protein
VDKNIDRYRAEKAAEKEREDVAAQRLKELEFQRETTYEVEKRRRESAYDIEELKQKGIFNKTQRSIGGFSYLRDDKNPDLEARNFINKVQADPEGFRKVYEDANTRGLAIAEATRHFATIRRGVGIYSQKDRFGKAYEGNLPLNHVPSQLRQISGVTDSLLLDLAEQFNSNPAEMRGNPGEATPPPANTVYSKLEGGVVKDFNLEGITGVDKALKSFRAVNLGYDRMNDTALKRKFMERVVGNFGSSNLDKQRVQRIVSAAGNSDVMNYLSGDAQPSREQEDRALAYFQDARNGFIDEETGLIDTANFVNFVNLFGMQNAGSAFAGTEPQPKRFSAINKGKIAKELNAVNEVGLAATAANTTIKEVLRMIDEGVTVGGQVEQLLTRAPFEAGAFVRSVGQITQTLTQTDRGYGAGKILGGDGTIQDAISKSAIGRLGKANELLKKAEQANQKENSVGTRRALAAAQLDMLELVLAYQVTGILQGGTGGRTISDTDVTRALKMFSSRFGTVDGRKKKLAFLQKLVTSSINKQRVYSILNNTGVNADMYRSVKRAARLLNLGVDQNNLTTEAAKAAGEQEDLSNAQDIYKKIIPIAGDNYNQMTYAAGINNVIRKDGQGQLVGNLVVNSDDFALWKNAVARFRTNKNSEELNRVKEKIIERGGRTAFDAAQGKEVSINWTMEGGKAGFDTGQPVVVPDPSSAMGVVPSRIQPAATAPAGAAAEPSESSAMSSLRELAGFGASPAELVGVMNNLPPEERAKAIGNLFNIMAGK